MYTAGLTWLVFAGCAALAMVSNARATVSAPDDEPSVVAVAAISPLGVEPQVGIGEGPGCWGEEPDPSLFLPMVARVVTTLASVLRSTQGAETEYYTTVTTLTRVLRSTQGQKQSNKQQ